MANHHSKAFFPSAHSTVIFCSKPIPVALVVKLLGRKEKATGFGPATRDFSEENPHQAVLNHNWWGMFVLWGSSASSLLISKGHFVVCDTEKKIQNAKFKTIL